MLGCSRGWRNRGKIIFLSLQSPCSHERNFYSHGHLELEAPSVALVPFWCRLGVHLAASQNSGTQESIFAGLLMAHLTGRIKQTFHFMDRATLFGLTQGPSALTVVGTTYLSCLPSSWGDFFSSRREAPVSSHLFSQTFLYILETLSKFPQNIGKTKGSQAFLLSPYHISSLRKHTRRYFLPEWALGLKKKKKATDKITLLCASKHCSVAEL